MSRINTNIWLKKNTKNSEEEIQLRKLCVQLSAEGKNVTQIHRELTRTRDWVYNMLSFRKIVIPVINQQLADIWFSGKQCNKISTRKMMSFDYES